MRNVTTIPSLALLALSSACIAPSIEGSPDEVGATEQALIAGAQQWARAGKFVKVYDPGIGESRAWYYNDHSFIKDASGTWHLFGITNPEPVIPLDYQVENEDQFGHATAPSLSGPWTKQPMALTTLPSYGETHLWAPHVIRHDGTYYMFYSGGGQFPQSHQINLATSTDLFNWTRAAAPLFTDGFQARDPMVIRADNRWIMYYTATLTPTSNNSRHVVAYRTSTTAAPTAWGPRQIAFEDPKTGDDAGPTESPYVVQRNGLFYLFIGPRPYHLYIPPKYPGTDVFVSNTPYSFPISQQVGHIPAHAAEVIEDGSNLWVSDAGWGLGGVKLARLDFQDLPVTGTKVYARSSTGTVLKWSSGTTWTTIDSNTSIRLVTGGFGTYSVRSNGDIYRYDGTGTNWTRVGGPATAFAVSADALYAHNITGSPAGVYKWTSGTTWEQIGGPASAIYAGGLDLFAKNNITSDIYRYNGVAMDWTKVGGPGSAYVVNANGLYGLNSAGVFQFTGHPDYWVQVGGAADAIYGGGNNLCAKVPFLGDINCYGNSPSTWSKAADPVTSFVVCDDAFVSTRSNGVYRKTGTTWTQVRTSTVAQVACGK